MMGGGKNQKGDVLMSADNVAGAIELIKKMIADVDKDGSGVIEYHEFAEMMTQKMIKKGVLGNDGKIKAPVLVRL